MSEHIKKYIEDVNKINEEIKAIKSADCIMDYDTKTEIIDMKKRTINELTSLHNTIVASGMELDFGVERENDER